MKHLLLVAVVAVVAIAASAPVAARKAPPRALPPVPQSADIARLNRESLAKIRPPAPQPPAPAPATAPR